MSDNAVDALENKNQNDLVCPFKKFLIFDVVLLSKLFGILPKDVFRATVDAFLFLIS